MLKKIEEEKKLEVVHKSKVKKPSAIGKSKKSSSKKRVQGPEGSTT
jgi:hypothetical protein